MSIPPPSAPPLSLGLHTLGGRWDGDGRTSGHGNDADAAQAFGFTGARQAAQTLSVPTASGDDASALTARFVACLFEAPQ